MTKPWIVSEGFDVEQCGSEPGNGNGCPRCRLAGGGGWFRHPRGPPRQSYKQLQTKGLWRVQKKSMPQEFAGSLAIGREIEGTFVVRNRERHRRGKTGRATVHGVGARTRRCVPRGKWLIAEKECGPGSSRTPIRSRRFRRQPPGAATHFKDLDGLLPDVEGAGSRPGTLGLRDAY